MQDLVAVQAAQSAAQYSGAAQSSIVRLLSVQVCKRMKLRNFSDALSVMLCSYLSCQGRLSPHVYHAEALVA